MPAGGGDEACQLAVRTVDLEVQRHGGVFENLERAQLDLVATGFEVSFGVRFDHGPEHFSNSDALAVDVKLHISGIGDEPQWGGFDFNAVRKIERSPNGLGAFGINVPNPIREGLKVQCAEGNAGQQGAEFHGPSVAGTRQKARFGVTVFESGTRGDPAALAGLGYEPGRVASWRCEVPAW